MEIFILKVNKFMLVTLVLLAIISFGAVSAASDNTTADDNVVGVTEDLKLSASDVGEINASGDDIAIGEDVNYDSKLGISADDTADKIKHADNYPEDTLKAGTVTPSYTIDAPEIHFGEVMVITANFNNATGNVTFTVAGKEYVGTLVGGIFTQEITEYNYNSNQVRISYSGDDYYKPVSTTKYVYARADVVANAGYYGQIPYLDINLYNATGNITVTLGGIDYKQRLENGKAIQNFSKYSYGSNRYSITYSGDDKFKGFTMSSSFNVMANTIIPEEIYFGQDFSIGINLGEATGIVNMELVDETNHENYNQTLVNGAASFKFENYSIGRNRLQVIYYGDDNWGYFATVISFNVLEKQDLAIYSTIHRNDDKSMILINLPNAVNITSLNVTVNGKSEILNVVDKKIIIPIEKTDVINEVNVTFPGNDMFNPTNCSVFMELNNIVTADNFMYYFNQYDGGKFFDYVEPGTTLDFQGYIGSARAYFDLNKPVNIISSTHDCVIDLNTTAGSYFGEDPGARFAISYNGSYSNITGINLHNTQLWIANAHHVVLDNISNVIEDQRVGSGVGATSVRENSTYVTVKNSYFYTRNNGGSSSLVMAWADYCTFDNNTVVVEGNVGNMIYLTTFNVNIPSGVVANCHNNITNNKIYGPSKAAGICWALVVSGAYNRIENNFIDYVGVGITTQFGTSASPNNTFCNNVLIGGASMSVLPDSIVYNNTVSGTLSIGARSTAYNNTVTKAMTVPADAVAYNNTVGGLTVSGANGQAYDNIVNGVITISGTNAQVTDNVLIGDVTIRAKNINLSGNEINGTVKVSSSDNTIVNNHIYSNGDYAIDLGNGANNNVSDNILYSAKSSGNDAVKYKQETNHIADNFPLNVNLTVNLTTDKYYYFDDKVTGTVTIDPNAKGNVYVLFNGQRTKLNVVNGTADFSLELIPAGQYILTAVYEGDSLYSSAEKSVTVTKYKYETSLDINYTEPVAGEDLEVSVFLNILPDGISLIPETPVLLIVDGQQHPIDFEYDLIDGQISNVKAKYTIKNVAAGTHSIVAILESSDELEGSYAFKSFTLNKTESKVLVDYDAPVIGQDLILNISVGDINDNVTVLVDDKDAQIIELVNGSAKYTIEKITEGTHVIVVKYEGNAAYTPDESVLTFNVGKISPEMDLIYDTPVIGQDLVVNVTVKDINDNVTVVVDGVSKVVELLNGLGSITVDKLSSGIHTIFVVYDGDNVYTHDYVYKSFILNKTTPVITVSNNDVALGDDLKVTVSVVNATGNVKIIVDGVENIIPLVNSIANFTLNNISSGNHSIVAIYEGNDAFNAVSESKSFSIEAPVIQERIGTIINVEKTFTRVANDFYVGERGGMFYATLTDINGNPLANKTVQIVVLSSIYNVTTDSEGKAGLPISLVTANSYTYALSFLGDDKYEASLGSAVAVITKKPTSIVAPNKVFKANAKSKVVSVTLKTIKNQYNGKYFLKAGKLITLKVNGKTYKAKTNANGVAKFTVKLTKKGKFIGVVNFAGDNTYKAVTKKLNIVIK